MTAILLTLLGLSVIFLGGVISWLWLTHPPQIVVSIDVTKAIPDTFALTLIHTANSKELHGADEPIPEEVLEYCDQESDEWARDSRKRRIRSLRGELGSWEMAFRQLQREDAG